MKIIVAGSRSIDSYDLVAAALKESGWWAQTDEVVCGCAPGVDSLGNYHAARCNLKVRHFPAQDYDTPNLRNAAMAEYADALVAVWDGESRGTRDMVGRMLNLGKPTFEATWTTRRRG